MPEHLTATDFLPFVKEHSGAWRVGSSRVLVEMVIQAFDDGATPESICRSYPAVSLAEVYDLIAYYLRHRKEIEDYTQKRDLAAEKLRAEWEAVQGDQFKGLKERLLARKASK